MIPSLSSPSSEIGLRGLLFRRSGLDVAAKFLPHGRKHFLRKRVLLAS